MRSYILDVEKRWEAIGRIDRPGRWTLLDLVKAHAAEFENLSRAAEQADEGQRIEENGAKRGRKLLPIVSRESSRASSRAPRPGERQCDECPAASVPDRQRCPYHLQEQRTKAREWYQRSRRKMPA